MLCFSCAILFKDFIKPLQLKGKFCAVEYTPTRNPHATPEFAFAFATGALSSKHRPCRAKV
jgi:hypothetical protein